MGKALIELCQQHKPMVHWRVLHHVKSAVMEKRNRDDDENGPSKKSNTLGETVELGQSSVGSVSPMKPEPPMTNDDGRNCPKHVASLLGTHVQPEASAIAQTAHVQMIIYEKHVQGFQAFFSKQFDTTSAVFSDEHLCETMKTVVTSIAPETKFLSAFSCIWRMGQEPTRTISMSVMMDRDLFHGKILPVSGRDGIIFTESFRGDVAASDADREKYNVYWLQKPDYDMKAVYAAYCDKPGFAGLTFGTVNGIAIRARRDIEHYEIGQLKHGTDDPEKVGKWDVIGVVANLASKMQLLRATDNERMNRMEKRLDQMQASLDKYAQESKQELRDLKMTMKEAVDTMQWRTSASVNSAVAELTSEMAKMKTLFESAMAHMNTEGYAGPKSCTIPQQ